MQSREGSFPTSKPTGKVYLVAAGPGDPRLLTLRAVQLLQTCDVVLFDALANRTLLKYVKANAECISVGKHGQDRIWTQNEIHIEILKHAHAGKSVARLKGGDTAIFARTGEEIEFLRSSNIDFEVVPGVTAASAASAYAGIPLTHRDWSSAVAFVTGHQQSLDGVEESDEDIDWSALARFPGTLVLYMAVTNTARWSRALVEGGMSPTTPVAIVRNASLPIQKALNTTLANVTQVVEGPPKLRPPIVFIVGHVTELQSTMDWFTRLPLYGTSILLTRPAGQNDVLSEQLVALGAHVLIQPALQLQPTDPQSPAGKTLIEAIDNVKAYDWIVFSSSNGVHAWMKAILNRYHDVRAIGSAKLAGVGPSVREALAHYNLHCDLCPESDLNAEHLAAEMSPLVVNKSLLVVSTNRARSTLQEQLSSQARVTTVMAYTSEPEIVLDESVSQALKTIDRLYVLASSSASAEALHGLLRVYQGQITWLSLSAKITDTLQSFGYVSVVCIDNLTAESIRDAVVQLNCKS